MGYRLALIGSLALLITGCATTRNTDKCTRIEEMQDCILHKLATSGPR